MRAEGAPFRAQFYRKNRLNFSLALLASLLTAALNLAIAWLLREMIDAVSGVTGAPGLRDLALLIAALLALIAAVKALEYYSKPRFMQRAMRQYKDFAFERLLTAISAFAGLSGVVAQLGTFLAGAWLAHAGMELTPGALIVFIDLTASVINPIREFPGLIAARKAASALTDKLAEALSVSVRDEGSPIPERLERGIELRDLSFAYEPGREVLHGITADFAPGRSTTVVGASGSGKSTLLRLLTAGHGSYTGEILIDGRELREISGGSLCELISVVEQNVFIFNASIRDNITMFQSFPQEEVERAIELSGLAALIEERGEGYLCGENGSGLSGGEKKHLDSAEPHKALTGPACGRGDGGAGRGFGPSGLERHPRPRLHDAHRRDPQPGRRAAAAL